MKNEKFVYCCCFILFVLFFSLYCLRLARRGVDYNFELSVLLLLLLLYPTFSTGPTAYTSKAT